MRIGLPRPTNPQTTRTGMDLSILIVTYNSKRLIGPLLTSSRLGRRYVMGHYQEGATHLYVSRGIGFEGLGAPRVRLLCPPEVALLELTAEQEFNAKTPGRKVKILTPKLQLNHGSWRLRGLARVHD